MSRERDIYLYTQPFVVPGTERTKRAYLLDYLSETDREDEEKVRSLLLRFAIDEKLIISDGDRLVPVLTEDTGSWKWHMTWMNFRALIDLDQYGRLMSSLQAMDNNPINQVLDLHSRLGALFDERLLNTIVDRTMASIAIIPYELPERSTAIEWDRIHRETPFVWVLILLQIVIRSSAVKII